MVYSAAMGLLLAWFLIVLFFYFKHANLLFEYVSFLFQHRGHFSLWHMYSLKALGSLALAAWIVWAAIQYGARLLARMSPVSPISRLEKHVFSAALGFGILSFSTFALGVLRLWYASVFWLLLIVATGWLVWKRSAEPTTPARQTFSEASPYRARASRVCLGSPAMRGWQWFAAGLLAITAVIFLVGDLSPEVFYDSLHYHLAIPNLYLISHRIYDQPNVAYSSLVMTVDLAWGFALTVGNEITAKLLHGAAALLLMASFVAFERRYLTPGAGMLGGLFFLSMPLVGMNATTAGTDIAVSALQSIAIFTLVRALVETHEEPQTRHWLRLSGVFTGLTASCKYTCLPAIPVACAVIVWWKRYRERREWKAIARQVTIFAVPAVLVVIPYFVKNIIFHHNPVYPFAATFWGEPRLSLENWRNLASDTQPRRFGDFTNARSLVQLTLHPWLITMTGRTSLDFIGPVLLGLLPVTLLARPSGKAYGLLTRYCLGLWAVWFLTTSTARFAMPLFAMASLVVADALLRTGGGVFKRTVLALSLAIVATNLYFMVFFIANSENWRVLFGQLSERNYLADAHPTYPAPSYEAFEWMNQHLPAGSKVLQVGDTRTLYTRVPVVPSSAYNNQMIMEVAQAPTADAMARRLREQGITHIFINFGEAVATESYDLFPWDPRSWAVLEEFWSRYPQLIWVSYRPDPANLKGLFVFKLRSDEESKQPLLPPSPNPLVRWKPK